MMFLVNVLLVILTYGHLVVCYNDTCAYAHQKLLCGNVCLDKDQSCVCGSQRIYHIFHRDYELNLSLDPKYCCAPASACTRTKTGANCSQGLVLSLYSTAPCYATGRCFNDVLTSQHISVDAKYQCQDKCISWKDMCQGLLCPGDEEVCGPEIRCLAGTIQYNMPTTPVRYYCHWDDGMTGLNEKRKNNGAYDLLDRSDEDLDLSVSSIITSTQSIINYTALNTCSEGWMDGNVGFECNGHCMPTGWWCNDKDKEYCPDSGVWTNDPRICSNSTFWQEISCNFTSLHYNYPGLRCTGAFKHCYYPQGPPDEDSLPTTCRDKSDRVFQVGEPCPDTPDNICWESCDTPGPGCLACTNQTYFRCPQTNQCLHPNLKCDGIPQCKGVDEDLDECKLQYQNNMDADDGRHKMSQYATFRCNRTLYPELETYATACDENPDCYEGEDEKNCNQTTHFIKFSLASISAIYLILRYGRKLYNKQFLLLEQKTHKVIKGRINKTKIMNNYYSKHSEDVGVFEELNCLLLNTIFTKKSDKTKVMGKHIYAHEEEEHKNDKNEVFACMHRNFDPLIMQTVIDSKFTGLTERAIVFLESNCGGRWITSCIDYIRAHEWLTDLLNTIMRLVKIQLQYLDVVKDSFLIYSLYRIVGGHQAFWDFPKEFSIVVVLCLAASVVVPVVFATLNLVLHNPFLIVTTSDKEQSGWRRATMTLVCCCLSFLNPILLVNNYEGAKEKTRKMAKAMDRNTIQQMEKTKEIKEQWTSFVRTELGKYSLELCCLSLFIIYVV